MVALGLVAGETAGAQSGTGIELLSGVGYSSQSEGASVLVGAELKAFAREGSFFQGLQEAKVGLHLSDEIAIATQDHTLTVGVDGEWSRTQGPFSFSMGGHAFFRQQGDMAARTVGIVGTGAAGRIYGRLRADYVEGSLGTFPWVQQDLEGLSEPDSGSPLYRAQVSVMASVIPQYRLNWSQEVKWRRFVDEPSGVMSVTTGPQFDVGSGTLGAQGGIIFGRDGVEPVWQIRYEHRPFRSNVDFQFTAATRSLDGDRPVVYGWLGVDGEGFGFGAAIHLQEDAKGRLSPAVYFSIHPKF